MSRESDEFAAAARYEIRKRDAEIDRLTAENEKLRAALAERPAVKVEDVTAITDALLERSGKFAALFSRAELEEHVIFAMAPQYRNRQS